MADNTEIDIALLKAKIIEEEHQRAVSRPQFRIVPYSSEDEIITKKNDKRNDKKNSDNNIKIINKIKNSYIF